MQVGEVQIKGGGTQALMAEDPLTGGQRDGFLQGHRGKPALIRSEGQNRSGIGANPDRSRGRLGGVILDCTFLRGYAKNPYSLRV